MRKLASILIILAFTITALSRMINDSSNPPTTLQVKRVSSNQIDLLWDDHFKNERRFIILRKASGEQKFKKIAAVPENTTSFRDSNLEPGITYFYKVRVKIEEIKPIYSNVAIATTAIEIPKPPKKLKAINVLPHKVLLFWKDKSKNELGFRIERKMLYGNFQEIAAVDANLNNYKDKKLSSNTTYIYRMTAYNEIGASKYSRRLRFKTKRTKNIPKGLKKLKAEAMSESEIKLTWKDKSKNEFGFKIFRSGDGKKYSEIDTVEADVTTYKDTGLNPRTTYYYRAAAFNKAGHSDFSNKSSATTNDIAPAAPGNLKATVEFIKIVLTWEDNSDNELGFKIERSEDGIAYTEIGIVENNTGIYSDTGLVPEKTYHYRILSYNDIGDSDYSNTASAATLDFLPERPSILEAVAVSSSRIDITWQDNSNNELGFRIERSENGDDFTEIDKIGPNTTAYSDTGLKKVKKYYYRVCAFNNTGNSDFGNTVSVTTFDEPPEAPSNLQVIQATSTSLSINWQDNSNDEDGFILERSIDGVNFSEVALVAVNSITYTDTGLSESTKYYYRVIAKKGNIISFPSNVVNEHTLLEVPTNLKAISENSDMISLKWIDNAKSESGFKIERSSDGTNFVIVSDVAANINSYIDSALVNSTTYYYRIRAFNNASYSDYSNVSSRKTLSNKHFFVSPNGNGDGSSSNPLNSIENAKLEVRNYIKKYGMNDNIYVKLKGGIYYLSSPLIFTSEDSGINGYKIIYTSYNNEEVIISGGMKVPDSLCHTASSNKHQKDGAKNYSLSGPNYNYEADLTSLGIGNSGIRQVYVNGKRAIRARENILESGHNIERIDTKTCYISNVGDFSHVTNQDDIEVVSVSWEWILQRTKVKSITKDGIYIDGRIISEKVFTGKWLENAKEFINENYEWYYDKNTKMLYLNLPESELPPEITIPLEERLIVLDGASHNIFIDLHFENTTWLEPNNEGIHPKLASVYYKIDSEGRLGGHYMIPGSIEFRRSNNIHFSNNILEHLGTDGIILAEGCKDITIENNIFRDISSNGIRLAGDSTPYGGLDPNSPVEIIIENITIKGNIIENVANEYYSSMGIFIGFVRNTEVINNSISNLPYTGILIGYMWDTDRTVLGNNTIQNNKIYNVLTYLADGAAIFNLGAHFPQSIIKDNKIYNIPDHRDEDVQVHHVRAGIYLDAGSNGLIVAGNSGQKFNPFAWEENTDIFIPHHIDPCISKNIVLKDNDFLGCTNHWKRTGRIWESYDPLHHLSAKGYRDLGVRFVDVDHNGLKDMIWFRWLNSTTSQRGVLLNGGKGWYWCASDSPYLPPYHIAADGYGDFRVEFVDFDGDGYEDMLYHRKLNDTLAQKGAYRNTGSGWEWTPSYIPPIPHCHDVIGDLGVRYVDVDHDGLKDIVQNRFISPGKGEYNLYLNSGSGWEVSYNKNYIPPYHISADGYDDMSVRFVDFDGDGYEDMLYHRKLNDTLAQEGAYRNTGFGWEWTPGYIPPKPLYHDAIGDLGVRFVDIDHNGVKDIVFYRKKIDGDEKGVYLNKNGSWVYSNDCDYIPPVEISIDGEGDIGVRFVDLNGDGYEDLIQGYYWYDKENLPQFTRSCYFNNSHMMRCE